MTIKLTKIHAEQTIHQLEDEALNAMAEDTDFNAVEWLCREDRDKLFGVWAIVHGTCYLCSEPIKLCECQSGE